MIQFKQVYKQYAHGQTALDAVDFEIAKGELVFITGHSGAGKSTILKLIAHIECASRGQVIVAGKNLKRLSNKQIPFYRRRLGLIFQDPHLLPEQSIFNNVALPLTIADLPQHEVKRRVQAALDKVGLLKKMRAYPANLSSGEQQRVGIARALVSKPSIVLADEPTGNLDPELSEEILKLFMSFNQVGVTIVMATHDQSLIADLPNRILQLSHGKIVAGDHERAA